MKILETKIGRILATDWIEVLMDKMIFDEEEKQRTRKIKLKKRIGLTDEERLCPASDECDSDLIKNVETLEVKPYYEDGKIRGNSIHQRVTYIDESVKEFNFVITLTAIPVPENYMASSPKKMVKVHNN